MRNDGFTQRAERFATAFQWRSSFRPNNEQGGMDMRTENRLHSAPQRRVIAVLLVCLAFTASAAEAQTATATKANAAEKTSPAEQRATEVRTPDTPARSAIRNTLPATSEKSDQGTSNGGGVFKPSEDISEDFAVPFPVDI